MSLSSHSVGYRSINNTVLLIRELFSLLNMIFPPSAELPVFKTRLTALWNVLHPDHFVVVLILSVLGALCSYSLTELIGYTSGLWHTCEVNR